MVFKLNKKGFTLVELLAVTIILIIITTIVIFTVNKQMEKSRLNAFIDEANVFAKAAQQKYSTDRTSEAISEDLFHNAIKGKVCYSIEQQLLGKYVEKPNNKYTGSVEVCYGLDCEYTYKVWITDGEHYIDGQTEINDYNDIKEKYTTEYPLTCGVEAAGGGGSGGDLLTAEFKFSGSQYEMTIAKDGVYALEAWGAQGGRYGETRGGYGGYAYTEVELHVGDKLYIQVGGQGGVNGVGNPGGYNGGADGQGSGGGGATTIATKPGFIYDPILIDYVYIIAGGGGGVARWCCCCGGVARGYNGGGYCIERAPSGATICQSGHSYGKATGYGGGGGYRAQSSQVDSDYHMGGSGYIGNPLTKNGIMAGFNVPESTAANTRTISTTNVSEKPISQYAKQGDGFAKITYIGTFSDQE